MTDTELNNFQKELLNKILELIRDGYGIEQIVLIIAKETRLAYVLAEKLNRVY